GKSDIALDGRAGTDQTLDGILGFAAALSAEHKAPPYEMLTVCDSLGATEPFSKTRNWRLFTTASGATLNVPSTRWKNLKLNWYSFGYSFASCSLSAGSVSTNLRSPCWRFSTNCSLPWNSFTR